MSSLLVLADVRVTGPLASLDPRLKLGGLAWLSTLTVLLDSTAALLALFVVAACVAAGLKLRPRAWAVVVGMLLALAWGTLLSQALFYAQLPRTALLTLVPPLELGDWHFPGLALYREGALYGLAQSLRILAVMLAGLAVCLSTSPERLLAALVKLRVPAAIGFTTVTALRFLPLLLSEVATVRQARRLRGYRFELRAVVRSPGEALRAVRLEMALFVPVLAAALRRAAALATSVTSRGFDPLARRTFFPELRFSRGEWCLLVLLIGTWTGIVAAKLLYWLYLAELLYLPELRELYDFARVWL